MRTSLRKRLARRSRHLCAVCGGPLYGHVCYALDLHDEEGLRFVTALVKLLRQRKRERFHTAMKRRGRER